jgi:hypothetical protein
MGIVALFAIGAVLYSCRQDTLLGERRAESVVPATDPTNLIWVMPAKGSKRFDRVSAELLRCTATATAAPRPREAEKCVRW